MALKVGELFAELKMNSGAFDSSLVRASRALGDVGKLSKITNSALLVLGTTMAGFAATGLKAAESMAQVQIGFNRLMGGETGGKVMTDRMEELADSLGLELEPVSNAVKGMMSLGQSSAVAERAVRATADAMRTLPTLSVETVTDSLNKLTVAGKLSSRQVITLGTQGIDVYKYLADAMGLARDQVVQLANESKLEDTISGAAALDAILKGMEKDFGGATAAYMKSAGGTWFQIRDTFEDTARALGEELLPVLKRGMEAMKTAVTVFKDVGTGGQLAAAGVIAVTLAIPGLISGLSALKTALTLFGIQATAASGPFGLIAAAAGATLVVVGLLIGQLLYAAWLMTEAQKKMQLRRIGYTPPTSTGQMITPQEQVDIYNRRLPELQAYRNQLLQAEVYDAQAVRTVEEDIELLKQKRAELIDVLRGSEVTPRVLPARAAEAAKSEVKDYTDEVIDTVKSGPSLIEILTEAALKGADNAARLWADALGKQLDTWRSHARAMASAMRQETSDIVGILKDRQNKTLDAQKTQYEKMSELGNAGYRAMMMAGAFTNAAAFGENRGGLNPTAADILSAAAESRMRKGQEGALNQGIQSTLYGNALPAYDTIANAPQFVTLNKTSADQLTELREMKKWLSDTFLAIKDGARTPLAVR